MADLEREISLQELEPSPVEETPSSTKDGYFPDTPKDKSSQPRHGHGLGLSQHSPIWYLTRLQKYSSYIFSAFAAAHITNTSIIPLITQSVPASERFLLLTRPYYQRIPAEPLLIIIPAWTHVLSGLALRVYRRNLNAKRYGGRGEKRFLSHDFWPSVSGISRLGFLFTPLLVGHAYINRVVPNQFPGGSSNVGLDYVSHAFAKHPAISYAGFTALLLVGVFHIVWGGAKWLGYTPEQVTTPAGATRQLQKKRRWYIVNGVAVAVTTLWMAGGFGVIGRGGAAVGWIAKQYDEMYRSIPLVGQWL